MGGRAGERAGTATTSDFAPGFAARHDAAAAALVQAFPVAGFAAQPVGARVARPAGPRHFSPAEPGARPTAGWNMLDPPTPADPFEAARAAGYAEGLAAAVAAVQGAEERDRALLADLTAALASAGRVDRDAMAKRLRETVLLLTGRLVGEIGIAADLLAARIEAATDLLADAAESALLHVHPDDVALLEGKLPKTVFAAGDASVPRGSFVLESASTIVEDGPGLWLGQLTQAIDRAAVPGV